MELTLVLLILWLTILASNTKHYNCLINVLELFIQPGILLSIRLELPIGDLLGQDKVRRNWITLPGEESRAERGLFKFNEI